MTVAVAAASPRTCKRPQNTPWSGVWSDNGRKSPSMAFAYLSVSVSVSPFLYLRFIRPRQLSIIVFLWQTITHALFAAIRAAARPPPRYGRRSGRSRKAGSHSKATTAADRSIVVALLRHRQPQLY